MLNDIIIENILFLDIETVPAYASYDQMPENLKLLWDKKAEWLKRNDDDTPDRLYSRAGIYAEFGKIVCITVGFFRSDQFRLKSFFGDDEREVLVEFTKLLEDYYNTQDRFLCAHNGKEFDFPWLARRILINGLKIPGILNLAGKKPWEVMHLDTMELWKFGDFKSFTSLELLATIFNIPTPKDDIDGSEVGKVYWQDRDLERIVRYCQKDVVTIARLLLKYLGRESLKDEQVTVV
jgi:hypothetical protein